MTKMKQQTAVEWYTTQLEKIGLTSELIGHLTEEAKEMEKQEQQKLGIILAAVAEEIGDKKFVELLIEAKQYYNKKYGKDNFRV